MESDLMNYLPQDDTSVKLLNKIYDEFQVKDNIIILVEADNIRRPEVLKEMDYVISKLDKYENDRGELDKVFSVKSLSSLIKDENAKIDMPDGLGGEGKKVIPDDINLIYSYMSRFFIQQMKGVLYTDNYDVGVIIIQIADNADYDEMLGLTKDAIDHRGTSYSVMTITGTIAVQKAMQKAVLNSLNIVFGLALLFVAIVIYLFHKNLKSYIICFLPLGYSLILTFGVIGVVHPQLTILSIAAVALLIGLGDDYSVYYSSRFAEEYTEDDKISCVEKTLKRTGKAVLLCAVATMIGFGSLMTSNMPPMVAFGLVCLLGTAFVFLSSTILVPCLCIILKFKKHETNHRWKRFAKLIVDQRKRMFAVGCFFVILSLITLPQVKTDVNIYEMAPKGIPEVEKLQEYSKNFGGGTNFNALLIETDSQGLTYPEVIDAIYELEIDIRNTGATAYSIADEIKVINEVLTRNIIIEKIANLTGVENLIWDKVAENGLITSDYSKTLIVVSFPVETNSDQLNILINEINSITAQATIPHNGKISKLVGQDVVTVEVSNQLISTQLTSMATELILILSCLIVGFASIRIGFLSLIPVLFVIAWEPGSLFLLGIPLSVINVTVAAIIVSTGIDYGIVITNRLKEERANGYSKTDALKITLETSGWSIVTASTTTMVALLATFAVDIPVLHEFSIIVILLYVFSIIASFCILPTVYTSKWFSKSLQFFIRNRNKN
jgi:hydrophobe/amphiphile efflux-3 (HAE3) family protein